MARVLGLAAGAAMVAALMIAGCGEKKAAPEAPPETALPMPGAQAPAALEPAGKPEAFDPSAEDGLQSAASVVELTYLQKQGDLTVKLFGTAGGDPAMNGLYTYVAFYVSTADGWRVFKLGDFLDYELLAETPGRIDLELRESTMNEATGEIGSRTRRVIVSWTAAGDAPPESIDVTPAK